MRLLLVVLLVAFIYPMTLSASGGYILVTSTKNKKHLRSIKAKLNKSSVNMLVQTTYSKYLIYAGPFSTSKSASYALHRVKKYFPYAYVLQKEKPKSIIKQTEVKSQAIPTADCENKRKPAYYISGALAYASAPSSHVVTSGTVSIVEPKSKGLAYILEGGYVFENSFVLSASYMNLDAQDLVFNNLYGSISYRFQEYKNFTPYFGLSAGYSSLAWNTDPIVNANSTSNNDSASFLWGTNAGVVYDGYDNVFIYMAYQCLFMNHSTNIEVDTTNTSTLEHNTLHSILLGIGYNF